jgi:hypothetical protein
LEVELKFFNVQRRAMKMLFETPALFHQSMLSGPVLSRFNQECRRNSAAKRKLRTGSQFH